MSKTILIKFGKTEILIGETKAPLPQSKTNEFVDLAGHSLPPVQWKDLSSYSEKFLYPLYLNLNILIDFSKAQGN